MRIFALLIAGIATAISLVACGGNGSHGTATKPSAADAARHHERVCNALPSQEVAHILNRKIVKFDDDNDKTANLPDDPNMCNYYVNKDDSITVFRIWDNTMDAPFDDWTSSEQHVVFDPHPAELGGDKALKQDYTHDFGAGPTRSMLYMVQPKPYQHVVVHLQSVDINLPDNKFRALTLRAVQVL